MGVIDKITSAFLPTKKEVWTDVVRDPYEMSSASTEATKQSSKVSDTNYAGYQSVIMPEIDFRSAYRYYTTIGKVQNVVDSYVHEILSRDWYYEVPEGQSGGESAVKMMDQFEEDFNVTRLIEYMVRDWLICGNSMIGTTDWEPVPLDTIVGMQRDPYGKTTKYVVSVNGKWEDLPLAVDKYIHTKYIEENRHAWGIGLFHSLMTSFDWQGTKSAPFLDIYRRHIQNLSKIEEKYASPIVVWAYENISEEAYKKQREALRAMKPGDRRITNKMPELRTETLDGRGGLIGTITPVLNEELESGLQSDSIRLITQPSAMADARAANEKDDARLMGIMERVRQVFNIEIIPRITRGDKVEFLWGTQDDFDIEIPVGLTDAINLGLVGKLEGREILKSRGWKLDDNLYNQEEEEKKMQMQQQMDAAMAGKPANGNGNGNPFGKKKKIKPTIPSGSEEE